MKQARDINFQSDDDNDDNNDAGEDDLFLMSLCACNSNSVMNAEYRC